MRALEDELPGEHFNTWVRPLQAVESNGALKLLAPNRFAVTGSTPTYCRVSEKSSGVSWKETLLS